MGEPRLSHFCSLSLLLIEAEEDLTFALKASSDKRFANILKKPLSAFAKGNLAYALRREDLKRLPKGRCFTQGKQRSDLSYLRERGSFLQEV